MFTFVENDTGSTLQRICTDQDGTAINLTGSTVYLVYRVNDGAVLTKTMTLTTPTSGICSYTFLTGELSAGEMRCQIKIVDSTGKILTSTEEFVYQVRRSIASTNG